MVIDISDILSEVGSSKDFEGHVQLKDISYQGDRIRFDKPFYVEGSVVNGGELFLLKGHIDGSPVLRCGRCLETYDYTAEYDIEVNLKPSHDEEDPDIYVYTNNLIDVDDIVIREFLLRLPIERRCSEECKGLCPYCGTNLNKEECQCLDKDHESIDSRLEVLKDFVVHRDREV